MIRSTVPGSIDMVFDNRKNCLTTPSGRTKPKISPTSVPRIAPNTRIDVTTAIGLFLLCSNTMDFFSLPQSGIRISLTRPRSRGSDHSNVPDEALCQAHFLFYYILRQYSRVKRSDWIFRSLPLGNHNI